MHVRAQLLERIAALEAKYAEARDRAEQTGYPYLINEARRLKRELEAMRDW